jgi:hypothetical protein
MQEVEGSDEGTFHPYIDMNILDMLWTRTAYNILMLTRPMPLE